MEFKNSRNEDNWQNRLKNLKKEKTWWTIPLDQLLIITKEEAKKMLYTEQINGLKTSFKRKKSKFSSTWMKNRTKN